MALHVPPCSPWRGLSDLNVQAVAFLVSSKTLPHHLRHIANPISEGCNAGEITIQVQLPYSPVRVPPVLTANLGREAFYYFGHV